MCRVLYTLVYTFLPSRWFSPSWGHFMGYLRRCSFSLVVLLYVYAALSGACNPSHIPGTISTDVHYFLRSSTNVSCCERCSNDIHSSVRVNELRTTKKNKKTNMWSWCLLPRPMLSPWRAPSPWCLAGIVHGRSCWAVFFIDYIPNCVVIVVFLGLGREIAPLGQIHPSQPPASSCVSRPHFYCLSLPTWYQPGS